MERLVRALALLLGERRLVHEDVRLLGHLEDACRRGGVARARRSSGPAEAGRAPARAHLAAGGQLDGLAGLEPPEERSLGDAQRAGGRDVEAPGPGQLVERVAVGGDAVRDREDEDPVVAAVERVPVPKLVELDAGTSASRRSAGGRRTAP